MNERKSVDQYIASQSAHGKLLSEIRAIFNNTELVETVKWGGPAYTVGKSNVVGFGVFKQFISIWFYQGVFLSDKKKILVNANEGVTRGLRQWRIPHGEKLNVKLLREYVLEAIENAKKGKEIKPEKKKILEIPVELKAVLKSQKAANEKFQALTPFKQREYTEFVSDAKQAETRLRRVEKIIPMIVKGIGLNDKYR